jgi:hypothetical protein
MPMGYETAPVLESKTTSSSSARNTKN